MTVRRVQHLAIWSACYAVLPKLAAGAAILGFAFMLTPAELAVGTLALLLQALGSAVFIAPLATWVEQTGRLSRNRVAVVRGVLVALGIGVAALGTIVSLGMAASGVASEITGSVLITAWAIPLASLHLLNNSLLRRYRLHKRLAITETIGALSGSAVALAVAYYGAGASAIAFSSFFVEGAGALLTLGVRSGVSFRVNAMRAVVTDAWRFATGVAAHQGSVQARLYLERFLIAMTLGLTAAGTYIFVARLIEPIQRTFNLGFSGFGLSRIARRGRANADMRESLNHNLVMMTFLALPVLVLSLVAARHAVRLFLPGQWFDASILFAPMATGAFFVILTFVMSNFLLALGQPGVLARISLVRLALVPAVAFLAAPLGLAAFGWFAAASSAIVAGIMLMALRRLQAIRVGVLLFEVGSVVAICLAFSLLPATLLFSIPQLSEEIALALVVVATGLLWLGIVYAAYNGWLLRAHRRVRSRILAVSPDTEG